MENWKKVYDLLDELEAEIIPVVIKIIDDLDTYINIENIIHSIMHKYRMKVLKSVE